MAGRTGLIPPAEAKTRIEAALTSLEKIPKFLGGFPRHLGSRRHSPVNGKPVFNRGPFVQLNRQSLGGEAADLAGRIDKILTPMNWGDLYDPSKGWYKGGWRLDKKDFDIHQKGWEWYYSFLAADTRFGSVWGIGTGQVPLESWSVLNRRR